MHYNHGIFKRKLHNHGVLDTACLMFLRHVALCFQCCGREASLRSHTHSPADIPVTIPAHTPPIVKVNPCIYHQRCSQKALMALEVYVLECEGLSTNGNFPRSDFWKAQFKLILDQHQIIVVTKSLTGIFKIISYIFMGHNWAISLSPFEPLTLPLINPCLGHVSSISSFNGFVLKCGNSIANALELPQSCIKPSIWCPVYLAVVSAISMVNHLFIW